MTFETKGCLLIVLGVQRVARAMPLIRSYGTETCNEQNYVTEIFTSTCLSADGDFVIFSARPYALH